MVQPQYNSLAVDRKAKYRVIWPSNYTPRHIYKENKNICSHKNLFMNVHSSIIYNNQKVETAQIFIVWMAKQNMVHSMGHYLSFKRNEVLICATLGWTLCRLQKTILYHSIYIKCQTQWSRLVMASGQRSWEEMESDC